eukprot:NODE_42_length_34079_cov_0.552619.p13 type:complete len:180 gc:universal NODE_42_length_34079_cov_0.552619:1160-621(-)
MIHILEIAFNHERKNFSDSIEMKIKFNAIECLQNDVNFKVTYVFDPQQPKFDRELDDLSIGPIPQGIGEFALICDPPTLEGIPAELVYGVQVLTLTLSYSDQEFCHIGYYVNTTYKYEIPFEEDENGQLSFVFPQNHPVVSDLVRVIHSDKPRVTRKQIDWQDNASNSGGAMNIGSVNI